MRNFEELYNKIIENEEFIKKGNYIYRAGGSNFYKFTIADLYLLLSDRFGIDDTILASKLYIHMLKNIKNNLKNCNIFKM